MCTLKAEDLLYRSTSILIMMRHAVCQHCKELIKYCKGGNTTNLRNHLNRKHPAHSTASTSCTTTEREEASERGSPCGKVSRKSNGTLLSYGFASSAPYSFNSIRQKEINKRIAEMIFRLATLLSGR